MRAAETPEARQHRLQREAQRRARRREEEREAIQRQSRAACAFTIDDYDERKQVEVIHSLLGSKFVSEEGRHRVEMEEKCNMCQAKMFKNEMGSKSKAAPGNSGMCCDHGRIPHSPPMRWQDPPTYLKEKLEGTTPRDNKFKAAIRHYNNMLAMTSNGAKESMISQYGNYQGRAYHRIGSIIEQPGDSVRRCAQLFVHDGSMQQETQHEPQQDEPAELTTEVVETVQPRIDAWASCAWSQSIPILFTLQQMLLHCNNYVLDFRSAYDLYKSRQQDREAPHMEIVLNPAHGTISTRPGGDHRYGTIGPLENLPLR